MGFLHPWFLLLGLGIIVPIAVHLFNFHRFKEVLFTNVIFLKNIDIQNKQQNKLLQRLLLFFRCLTLLLLALLFSQPYIKDSSSQLNGSTGNNAVVVIVDNSFSMQNSSSKGTLLQTAKVKAIEILNEYTDNDVFCLLTQDKQGIHKHFGTKKTFKELLQEVTISPCSLKYSDLVNTAHHLLSLRSENNKRMFFISDFQEQSFDAQNMKQDTNVMDVFIPLLPNNINNVFVDSLAVGQNIFLAGQKVDLTVRVRNASDEDVEKLTVKLYINDKQQSLSACDIKANSYADVPMSFIIEQPGFIKGKIHIIDNPIIYDDDFYFAVNVGEKIKLLSVNANGENTYIGRLFKNASEIQADNVNENNIDFSILSGYDVIILNELKEINSGLVQELNRQRQRGISLVIIPPKDMNIDSYRQSMTAMQLPYYDSEVKTVTKTVKLDDKNKLFADVFSAIDDNMELPSSNIYFKIRSTSATSRQDIINYSNDDAFLTVSENNTSKVYIFSTPFDKECTDFVSQSLFVPVMWNIALYSSSVLRPYFYTDEDAFVDISSLTDRLSNEIVKIQSQSNPKNEYIPRMQLQGNRNGFTIGGIIKQVGFYDIKDGNKTIGILSMNYPRQESVLRFLSKTDIEKSLKNAGYRNYDVFNNKKMIKTYFEQSKKGFDFSVILLVLMVLSLLSEAFIVFKIRNN